MKPWCAEGEVPTAANLKIYRGWRSCLVGIAMTNCCLGGEGREEECGEAKLIVSVSFGSTAVFIWRRQSCLDDEGHLCCLGHGDIPVMDGQCQHEFLHRTDPGREQERINVTFHWVKQHVSSCTLFKAGVACCLPTCAHGLSVPVTGVFGFVFGVVCFFVSSRCFVHMGTARFAGLPVMYITWVIFGVILGTPFVRGLVGALPS